MQVLKRNGERAPYEIERIATAISRAFEAADQSPQSVDFDGMIERIDEEIRKSFCERSPKVEEIQDLVERHLVEQKLYEVSKRYMIYREKHRELREQAVQETIRRATSGRLNVVKRNGSVEAFHFDKLERSVLRHTQDLNDSLSVEAILKETTKNIFDGVSTSDIEKALILATSSFIERDPVYDALSSRLYLQRTYREVFGRSVSSEDFDAAYRSAFREAILQGSGNGQFDSRLSEFDLEALSEALKPERDDELTYIGIQTLYERYFIRINERLIETPQAFWMRVAMGLALLEEERESRAIEFYNVLSDLRFVCSTPTLFHSGLSHPQLSSCYLSTVNDELSHIFKVVGDNAQLSKWSGGIGNDWTNIRATGASIHSTNVQSQGVIPFLKIANDTTVAINRSGKRRGATCAYLETWHLDIEDFLDLRKNTGDDRRRTHDMNTANWIPDLFMKRVEQEKMWTLFSPDEVPDLHDLCGRKFEERYEYYEQLAEEGKIRKFRTVEALKLWRKMLTRLFETGHPWITFKDPSNLRSPQDHAGVVHNSNLCTEITLNNSADETAVCNLGSVNLARHVTATGIQTNRLEQTVQTAMRMLDNVIDINFYPTVEARNSNMRHRPVGLGLMGFQDALFIQRIPFSSERAIEFADATMEHISYNAILGSSRLAAERGAYESYKGSKWDRGIFPLDTLDILEAERGRPVPVNRETRLDWDIVRRHVSEHGMRNSNTMAIAPTATISNIAGSYPCIEPIYKNIYVKSNMSGEFTVVNKYLIRDLKAEGHWNANMLEQLKYYDGNVAMIDKLSDELKELYTEAFDIDPSHLVKITAARGKWIDQSQSHNVFMRGVSGKKLHEIYTTAWQHGLKTTYYLRSLAATQIEKSTLDANRYGYTQKREYHQTVDIEQITKPASEVSTFCSLDDPDCEACQ